MDPLIDSGDMHVAVIYPKAIGDLLFVLPALYRLRRGLPLARITLVCKKKQEPLARLLKGGPVDSLLSFGNEKPSAIRRALKSTGVNVMVDYAGNDQAGLIMTFMPGRRIRPCRSDCRGMCALYSPFASTLPKYSRKSHRVEQFLAWTALLVDAEPDITFELPIPQEAQDAAEEVIARHQLRNGKVVALNLGASRDTKRWPKEHFKALAEELMKRDCRVVIMGAHEFKYDRNYDSVAATEFAEAGLFGSEKCVDLVNDSKLSPDLQLQRDSFFLRYSGVPAVTVGNDTGPMHIAGSVGADAKNRTVSLFGPTNPIRYSPYDPSGEYNVVLTASGCECLPEGSTEVCPSYKSGCAHTSCMKNIAVEKVAETVCGMIAGSDHD